MKRNVKALKKKAERKLEIKKPSVSFTKIVGATKYTIDGKIVDVFDKKKQED